MNSIFHENLNDFFFIYIDDILVYTKIVEEHVGHLQYILRKLTKNQFFVNHMKNEFVFKRSEFPWTCAILDKSEAQPKKAQSHTMLAKVSYDQRN
jgi:hypothetical protein